ncbi:hypothetical protein [Micromonospora sp. NPDC003776]
MPGGLRRASDLDPADCVAHVAENFSVERMALGYESVYRSFLAARAAYAGERPAAPVVAR